MAVTSPVSHGGGPTIASSKPEEIEPPNLPTTPREGSFAPEFYLMSPRARRSMGGQSQCSEAEREYFGVSTAAIPGIGIATLRLGGGLATTSAAAAANVVPKAAISPEPLQQPCATGAAHEQGELARQQVRQVLERAQADEKDRFCVFRAPQSALRSRPDAQQHQSSSAVASSTSSGSSRRQRSLTIPMAPKLETDLRSTSERCRARACSEPPAAMSGGQFRAFAEMVEAFSERGCRFSRATCWSRSVGGSVSRTRSRDPTPTLSFRTASSRSLSRMTQFSARSRSARSLTVPRGPCLATALRSRSRSANRQRPASARSVQAVSSSRSPSRRQLPLTVPVGPRLATATRGRSIERLRCDGWTLEADSRSGSAWRRSARCSGAPSMGPKPHWLPAAQQEATTRPGSGQASLRCRLFEPGATRVGTAPAAEASPPTVHSNAGRGQEKTIPAPPLQQCRTPRPMNENEAPLGASTGNLAKRSQEAPQAKGPYHRGPAVTTFRNDSLRTPLRQPGQGSVATRSPLANLNLPEGALEQLERLPPTSRAEYVRKQAVAKLAEMQSGERQQLFVFGRHSPATKAG